MCEIKIGQKVSLAIDSESIYEVIEIIPNKIRWIKIRKVGNGLIVDVSKGEITVIK